METTTQQPCWPDRTITGAFVGWFMDRDAQKNDVYIVRGDEVAFVEKDEINFHPLTDVLKLGCTKDCDVSWAEGARLVSAHLAKQSAPPAPAMSREQMIEAGARASHRENYPDGLAWDGLGESVRRIWLAHAEEVLIGAKAIQPLPKPAPVEAKTANELAAERIVQPHSNAAVLVACGKEAVLAPVPTGCSADLLMYALRKVIAAALAARDAAHQSAIVGLRERMTKEACEWFLLFGQDSWKNLQAKLRAVALTAPEAK